MDKYEALRVYYGHDAFRPGQEALIDGLLAGRDVLGIMPTGGGKSLCYQIPAILSDRPALVVSPLISLMKDQVMALKSQGVAAAYLNSSLDLRQQDLVLERWERGAYRILYVAPERLEAPGFLGTRTSGPATSRSWTSWTASLPAPRWGPSPPPPPRRSGRTFSASSPSETRSGW